MNALRITLACVLFHALTISVSVAQKEKKPSDDQRTQQKSPISIAIDFETDVWPILQSRCVSCHGPKKQESNYRMDLRDRALGTADFGLPPIIPGNRDSSPLFQYIQRRGETDIHMPPDQQDALSAREVNAIGSWIEAGAKWPDRLAGNPGQPMKSDLWSLKKVRQPDIPSVNNKFPRNNPIDSFVIAQLCQNKLDPSPPADRVTWIRRVYLIMHGLLPTPEQVSSFINDDSPDAKAKVVEDVLASRHYGERWARHWLDVVRYAESTGFEVNRRRTGTHFFRDYVIKAFNSDKPYRDFIIEQIAGDAVGVDAANGFLVGGGNDIVKSPDVNLTQMQRQDELADIVNTTCTAFLGLTVSCARCHNHKFDPILQSDYYAVQAVFAGVQHGTRNFEQNLTDAEQARYDRLVAERDKLESTILELRNAHPPEAQNESPIESGSKGASGLLPMVDARRNLDSFSPVETKWLRFEIAKTNSAEPCIDELEIISWPKKENVALDGTPSSSGDYQGNPKHKLKHINDGQYGNPRSWIANSAASSWVQIELTEATSVFQVIWGRDRNSVYRDRLAIDYTIKISLDGKTWQTVSSSKRRASYRKTEPEAEDAFISRLPKTTANQARTQYSKLTKLREQVAALNPTRQAYLGNFQQPAAIYRLHRGDPMAPREEVPPGAISILGDLELDSATPEQQRRMALAHWIASPDNPLTARVLVNRVWHYHFGRGIVATPSDFGNNGIPPTHPELLDWLAVEFVNNDWSLKWLHRQILLSATFGQSSRPRPDAIHLDAQNHLLWRFQPRRLEAEAIRDCILQASGKLNPKSGGPGFLLFQVDGSETVHKYFPRKQFGDEQYRRMIYMTKIRQEQDDVFGVFDCPDGGQVIPNRSRSTTPLQALNMLNSQFMIEQANFLASRIKQHAQPDPKAKVRWAFRNMLLREPNPNELRAAVELIRDHGIDAFCRAILNANEFLFVS